jgi:hypothetical protein
MVFKIPPKCGLNEFTTISSEWLEITSDYIRTSEQINKKHTSGQNKLIKNIRKTLSSSGLILADKLSEQGDTKPKKLSHPLEWPRKGIGTNYIIKTMQNLTKQLESPRKTASIVVLQHLKNSSSNTWYTDDTDYHSILAQTHSILAQTLHILTNSSNLQIIQKPISRLYMTTQSF